VDEKCIVFTSGATESNNIALKGVMWASKPASHLIVNSAEHKAVLDPAKTLERQGYEVTVLPVDRHGMVDPQQVAAAIRPNTVLVSVMLANNEVGTINPIHEIGDICRQRKVLLHSDATQAIGKLVIDLSKIDVDLLSFSAHKMYGPKGIGALYVRRRTPRIKIEPLLDGGGHERRLRSGTLPVPLIVGFGAAAQLCNEVYVEEEQRLLGLRNRLWIRLVERVEGIVLNGHPDKRLSGNANITFPGVNSEAIMLQLKNMVAVSSGSACTSADPEPSHVLLAMGVGEEAIKSTIRFGLGRFNTIEQVDAVAEAVANAARQLRRLTA
jgi:cysteine desulfurase